MRYTDHLQPEQVNGYLARLELDAPISNDLEGLNRLLFAQLTHIPFDSLDVWGAGLCPSLQIRDLYEKIIVKKRGGYCFELNTLFRGLLNALGFDAYQCAAYILHADRPPEPPSHNVLLCPLQGKKYYLDVGYGGPVPYRALELREGKQGEFLLKNEEGLWSLTRVTARETRPLTAFRDIPASVTDLLPLNFYVSQHPDIHFRHVIHLNRRYPDGSLYALDGTQLKIRTGEKTEMIPVESIARLKEILTAYYGIDPATVPLRDSL